MTNLNSKELLEGVTPGDWKVETHHRFGHDRMVETKYLKAENDVGIAVQPAFSDDTTAEANFRLIASAPRLARRVIGLEEALRKIAYLRPAGDIDTAKNTRALVKQIEEIALAALTIQGEAK